MKEVEFTLAGFAAWAGEELLDNVEHAREEALILGAKAIKSEARRVIGTYDYGWPQLSPVTQAEREHLGFSANEPLLRSGEIRDSIEFTIITPGVEAEIGSDNDIAVWQELGTSTIPARSFLAGAGAHMGKPVARMMRDLVGAAVAGKTIETEIIKVIVEAFKELGDDVRELVDSDDEQNHDRHGR